MARMYPDRLPEGRASDAEYDLFAAFERELDATYTVFAGVNFLLRRRHGARDGEADFVVVHPSRGLLVIEVKGGQIGRDGATGQWYSTDRHGKRHAIKDPVEQARVNAYSLADKLAEAPQTARFSYPIAHAVALPDVRLKHAALDLAAPAGVTIDQDDYGAMQPAVERIFAYALGDRRASLGGEAMRALVDVISPSWEVQVALKAQLRAERAQVHRLTEEQFFVLDMLAGHRRALVDGCAGSGKTFLAIEKARRLASEGFDTLLTCFNRNLASWIRDSLDPHPDRLRVQHFHELAHQLVNQAGLQTIGSDADLDRYFKETLPTLLLDAIDRIDTRFEAIVVDEGQDFEAEWWVPLMGLLRAPDDIMYVFYDSRQSIYTDAMSLPFDSDPHFLPVNLRNTQAIHRLIAPHYTGQVTTCRGPEGRAPRHLRAGDPEAALRAELHRLVHDEGIPTGDIVVLTAAGRERSRWREGQRIGNQRLTWEDAPGHDEVRVATIHSFKGLERPVVIVTESDRARGPHRDQLQLVARSRAMSELVIIDSA